MGGEEPGDSHLARVRALILRYGWNSTAYQILNPGIAHWFSSDGEAVVGYVERGSVRVVAGAPVCEAERLPEIAANFEVSSADGGASVCYFGAEERLESLYRDSSTHSRVLLGAQPAWKPEDWPEIVAGHSSLRAQLNRAANKGVVVSEWPASRAAEDSGLQRCLDEWLSTRGLPPLHFLVEPETLARLFDRRIFVGEQDAVPVGFLVASPIPRRNGWLIEQFVRGHGAPNGTIELMIDTALHAMIDSGSSYVTLGLSPLSPHAPVEAPLNPAWLKLILGWVRAHGRRFYNFEGLDAFKRKFQPQRWEPIYAISNESHFSPRSLYAIAAAFSDRSVASTVGRALVGAVKQEAMWKLG
ncbi:MAG TPA: DUF2156 domain-containing protein [Longimicrobiaceae bacterium]|nr:DUF2156 domain-containing protein [Longimicrobiaceae bacterium]